MVYVVGPQDKINCKMNEMQQDEIRRKKNFEHQKEREIVGSRRYRNEQCNKVHISQNIASDINEGYKWASNRRGRKATQKLQTSAERKTHLEDLEVE